MPIKVTITLTQDVQNILIRDRYNNNKEIFPNKQPPVNLAAWEKITLDQVTTNGSSPPMGKLQITAKVKNEAGQWEQRDERVTVAAGWHEWPAPGMVSLIEMMMNRNAPPKPGGAGAVKKAQ